MKKLILCASILISLAAAAQTATHKNTSNKHRIAGNTANTGKISPKNAQSSNNNITSSGTTNVLTNSSANSAYASEPASTNGLQISDPIIRTLNAKANGKDVQISSSGIIGMPKRTYGFANGHLIFRPSDATTSGTSTGSGAVGTGSSPGAMGTSGAVMGVNGKSPYAGPGIYGAGLTGAGVDIKGGNSDIRPHDIKKDH